MTRPPTVGAAKRALRAAADPARARVSRSFFKTGPGQYGESDRFLGIATPQLRQLARQFDTLTLPAIEKLLQSPWHEERALALLLLVHQYQHGDRAAREAVYDLYLRNTGRINNWDLVDCSAEYIVGPHVPRGKRAILRRLAKSDSLWERRIAVLATRSFIRQGDFEETLRIAAMLLEDPEDLIHKAVGWMLREIGDRDRAAEERFLEQHAAIMPRTMLRYAIEKFPAARRRHYMRRT